MSKRKDSIVRCINNQDCEEYFCDLECAVNDGYNEEDCEDISDKEMDDMCGDTDWGKCDYCGTELHEGRPHTPKRKASKKK